MTRLLVGREGRLAQRADDTAQRLERVSAGAGAEQILEYWRTERVLTLAVHRARTIGVERESWSALEGELREQARTRGLAQDFALMQLTRALERAGVESLVLKGAPMARRLYGEAELRSRSGDVDLLVPVGQLDQASSVIMGLGWGEAQDARYEDGLPDHHAAHPGRRGTPNVELHWRVQWYERSEHSAALLENAVTVDRFRVPSPVDQLSILLLAFARDGLHGLRLAADVAAWWDRWEREGVDLAPLWRGALARPHAAAALGAHAVVGSPPPPPGHLGRAAASVVERLALSDEPMEQRSVFARVAMVDVAAAPRGLRRERLLATWLRSPEYLEVRYPELSRRFGVSSLRVASAVRTTGRAAVIAVRAGLARRD